jgi:hypothetical protein
MDGRSLFSATAVNLQLGIDSVLSFKLAEVETTGCKWAIAPKPKKKWVVFQTKMLNLAANYLGKYGI